jgi:hypothetical protein
MAEVRDGRVLSDRWRWAILIALVTAGVVGTVSVYLLTAHNRDVDRKAVLAYETQILAPIRDVNVVAGSLADAATAFRGGKVGRGTFVNTLGVYRKALQIDATRVDAVKVPVAFGANANMFAPIAHGYLDALKLYLDAATAANRGAAMDAADAGWQRALSLYHQAVDALQTARLRLGYPKSSNFGDPPR